MTINTEISMCFKDYYLLDHFWELKEWFHFKTEESFIVIGCSFYCDAAFLMELQL